MPRAGWCRECGEWVWVDGAGGCPEGHGPECVNGIYDAQEGEIDGANRLGRGFGSGEMPPELNRFNWGALLLPSVWGLVYGVLPVLGLWLVSFMTPYVLIAVVSLAGASAVTSATVGITVIAQLVATAITLYIGANATRMLWRKEQLRLELIDGAKPRFSVEKFVARQRLWVGFGIAILMVSVAGLAIIGLGTGEAAQQVRTQFGVSPIDAAGAFVWVVAEIVLGLWLAAQMRKEATSP